MSCATPSGELPIGVFDSGIGGLTVVGELSRRLPGESLIYLGDTARVPYGTKSPETVIAYSTSNARFLLSKGIKMLVVACNTASATALCALGGVSPVPVVGVIEPGARRAVRATSTGSVGVIGTPSTIRSGAYTRAIHRLDGRIEVHSASCPLFVPLADEGLHESELARMAAAMYLEPLKRKGIDTLILGCTHYPLLKGVIAEVMGPRVRLVDSAEETAGEVERLLEQGGLKRRSASPPVRRFYLTDVSDTFLEVAERFLRAPIDGVEHVDIGAQARA